MDKFLENLKHQAEDNPVLAMGVAAGLLTAVGKLMEAHTNARNSKAWSLETQRRVMKDAAKLK